jgi:DNA-binding SARP family transcriptional activator
MRVGVLGPLLAIGDHDEPVEVGRPKQRTVLALLLANADRLVTAEQIIDELWEHDPPRSARANVHTYTANLRRALRVSGEGHVRLETAAAGYVLRIDPERFDVARYTDTARRGRSARRTGDLDAAIAHFDAALAEWRGDALEDVPCGSTLSAWRVRLREDRAAVLEDCAETCLEADRPNLVVPLLRDHTRRLPLRERGWELLLDALARTGDTAGALVAYQEARDALVEQLGIEPGPGLRERHRAILSSRTEPPPTTRRKAATLSRPAAIPAQLPANVSGFAGRADELTSLDAVVAATPGQPAAVVISAVSGTAGVGKTALAVHWAHRVRDRFPDGQLYVNLRGFDPAGAAMATAEVIRRFLDALAVPPQRIPADPGAQLDLFRTLLADKRMLVVLDNARDPDQVRALLPGAPGCLVLVTSRNRLTGLVATTGAHALSLDLLTQDEARDLLTRRLGPARVSVEPEAVNQLITRCARLPLALAIVAATAATHPHRPLTALADQLRHSHDRLDALATGDTPATDVRAVFSWSYQALSEDSARMFRLLGLHPGPDISTAAAASLAGLPIDQVRSPLNQLANAHLVNEHRPGRYSFHDLLRAYAVEQADTTDPAGQRHAGTGRMLDHYLHTAHTADRLLLPARVPITLTPPRPGVAPEHPADHEQALAWFSAEHAVLLAAIDHAAATGSDAHTWQLAWTIDTYLNRRGHWRDLAAVAHAAVAAAGRLADLPAQARAHRLLARAHLRLGRLDDAYIELGNALDLFGRADDPAGQADIHLSLGHVWERRGQPAEALHHAGQALGLFRAAGHRRGQALALNAVGWCHALHGDHQQALTHCQQALALHQELVDHHGQAATWDSLGYAHHHLGHHAQAIACYRHAADLYRTLGDRYNEADVLTHLGDTHQTAGNPDAARTAWLQALTILDQLDYPDADQVRSRLGGLGAPTSDAA